MRIGIIGSGWLGLPVGLAFASKEHRVLFHDREPERLKAIAEGRSFCKEAAVQTLLDIKEIKNRITVSSTLDQILAQTDVAFVVVDTPLGANEYLDTSNLEDVATGFGEYIKRHDKKRTLVIKSTLMPGTIEGKIIPLIEKVGRKQNGRDFAVAYNPSFTNEGRAIADINSAPIIIGAQDNSAFNMVARAYAGFSQSKIRMSILEAEFAKVYVNGVLPVLISYANDMAKLGRRLGVDTARISEEMCKQFAFPVTITPGIGYGGPCLPKDLRALRHLFTKNLIQQYALEAAHQTNLYLPNDFIDFCIANGLDSKVAVLGATFKENVDDTRESLVFPILRKLDGEGRETVLYDPSQTSLERVTKRLPEIQTTTNLDEALAYSNSIIILAAHRELKNPQRYVGKKVFDARASLRGNLKGVNYFRY